MQPPRKTDPTNPFARRTPWGVAKPAPFKLGLGPASMGGVKAPGHTAPESEPAPQGPKLAPPPPKMGSGILGSSPLIPKAARQARPAATPLGVPIRPSGPRSAPARTAPSDAPPPDLDQLASRLREPAAPVGRRLLIVGVALGVIALIAAAAVMLSERNAQLEAATPVTAAVTPPDLAPSAAEATAAAEAAARTAAEPAAEEAGADPLPTAPIYRAETPAGTTPAVVAPRTTAAPPAAQTVAAPVLPPPAPVELPPVVEAPPAPRSAPPPAAVRPPVDPDAPIVLRRDEG